MLPARVAVGVRRTIGAQDCGATYTGKCADFPDWVKRCGIACAGGKRAPDCTKCRFELEPEAHPAGAPERGTCAGARGWTQEATIASVKVAPKSSISTIPVEPADAGEKQCADEWNRFRKENDTHEQTHAANCAEGAAKLQATLTKKLVGMKVTVCAVTQGRLGDALAEEVVRLAAADIAISTEEYNREPHQPVYPRCSACPCDDAPTERPTQPTAQLSHTSGAAGPAQHLGRSTDTAVRHGLTARMPPAPADLAALLAVRDPGSACQQ